MDVAGVSWIDFEVTVEPGETRTVVRVRGELDCYTADRLARALDDAVTSGVARVEVDVRELTFIDSTGLRVLVKAFSHLQERGGELSVTSPQLHVSRLLEISGLSRLLDGRPGGAAR